MGEVWGPERPGGQGLDPNQWASGDRAIHALLTGPGSEAVDLVCTWRAGDRGEPGAYEVWSARGMVRFRREIDDRGHLVYPTVEIVGADPLADDRVDALSTLDEEIEAARAAGHDPDGDGNRRFIPPEHQSYPFGRERVAQLFDSPHAPDLVVSPVDWCQGGNVGNHGALHVRQARAPLWFSGPGIRPGVHDLALRSVDIAPTCLAALGFPLIDGRDATGRTSSERGVPPDVYLRRQDGRVVHELLDPDGPRPRRLVVICLDGLHHTELEARLAAEPDSLPGLGRLRRRAAVVAHGQMVTFPSITWPSHTTIGTGTWCGHHDVVNPTYHLRHRRETVSPQGQQMRTEGYASSEVESLAEAFHRVRGDQCLTAAVNAPFGRSARHAVFEGRNLCDRDRLRSLNPVYEADSSPRWDAEGDAELALYSRLDARAVAQMDELFSRARPPEFVYLELIVTDGAGHHHGPHAPGLREALLEADRRVARVLDICERAGVLDETLFVVTADHGMAPQDTGVATNPVSRVAEAGLEGVIAEPMVWLRDLAPITERAADRRTGRVRVLDNDALADGTRAPVADAVVTVSRRHPDGTETPLARCRTDVDGFAGFGTPGDAPDDQIVVAVEAPGFNPRRITLGGADADPFDLRAVLYGS